MVHTDRRLDPITRKDDTDAGSLGDTSLSGICDLPDGFFRSAEWPFSPKSEASDEDSWAREAIRKMHSRVPPDLRSSIRSQGDLLDNRYRLGQKLGMGGSGVVYRAWDEKLHRDVAIKLLHPGYSSIDRYRHRLIQEARAASQIIHDHVVRVIDVVANSDSTVYLVMEWIDGDSVANWLRSSHGASMAEIARIVRQAAEGLKAAHSLRIVHRDVKCSNLLVDRSGRVKVADFGLAREVVTDGDDLSRTDEFAGTIPYMSPEQLRSGMGVDARTDIYSLGVVLFELITATRPFRGTAPAMIDQILTADPPRVRSLNPACPEDLATITEKCLRKSPDQRYASAEELSDDLGRWLEGRPILARPLNRLHRAWRLAKRYPAIASLACTVVTIAVATTILAYGLFRETRRLDSALQVAYELLRGVQDGRLASVDDAFSEIMQGTSPIDDSDREALHHLFSAILQLQTASQRENQSTNRAGELFGMIDIFGSLRSLQEVRAALDSLDRTIELSEGIGLAWLLRAQIRQEILGENPEQVLPDWLRAIRSLPTCSAAAAGHGWCLKRLKKTEEATAEFERALALDPLNEFARRGLALILYDAQRFDQAAVHLLAAVTQPPRYNLDPEWASEQKELLGNCFWNDGFKQNENGNVALSTSQYVNAILWSSIEDRKSIWPDLLEITSQLTPEERQDAIDQLVSLNPDPPEGSFLFTRDLFIAVIASDELTPIGKRSSDPARLDRHADSSEEIWAELASRLANDSGITAEINSKTIENIREYVSELNPLPERERLIAELANRIPEADR